MAKVATFFSTWLEAIALTETDQPLSPNGTPQTGKPRSPRHRIYVSLIDYPLTF